MPDAMKVAVDAERALRVMDYAASSVDGRVFAACLETAQLVADGARRVISKRTGETAAKIHWERSRDGKGFVVMAYDTGGKGKCGRTRQHHVDLYLEKGTKFMYARPFFWSAVAYQQEAHRRRIEAALRITCDEVNR
jgi:hypothetical protein